MESKFEFGATEKLFERISKDETGKLKEIISEIVFRCREAAEMEVPMDELASVCTMGWYMGIDPSVEAIFNFILQQTKPDPQIIN